MLVVALCVANIVWLLLYTFAEDADGSVLAVSIVVSMARVIMFWIFAITLYQWLSIAFSTFDTSSMSTFECRCDFDFVTFVIEDVPVRWGGGHVNSNLICKSTPTPVTGDNNEEKKHMRWTLIVVVARRTCSILDVAM